MCFLGDWWGEQRQKQCDLHGAEGWGRKQLLCANLKSECVKRAHRGSLWCCFSSLVLQPVLGLLPSIHGCNFQSGRALNLRALGFSMEPVQVLSWFYSLLRLFQTHPCLSVGFKLDLSEPNLVLGPQVPLCPHRERVANLHLTAAGKWFGLCVGSCPSSVCALWFLEFLGWRTKAASWVWGGC